MLTKHLAKCLNSVLNVKALVGAFNQEKALVGAFSVITNLRMDLFEALQSIMLPWTRDTRRRAAGRARSRPAPPADGCPRAGPS